MARIAEQNGKNELALHLLGELDRNAACVTLSQWEPDLLFEVKARRLKLLRMKAGRSEAEKNACKRKWNNCSRGLLPLSLRGRWCCAISQEKNNAAPLTLRHPVW